MEGVEAVPASIRRDMLRYMLLTQAVDDEAARLQNQGAVDLWLSCRGQEAAQVASACAVGGTATIFPSYREHGVAVARGITATSLVAQWAGSTYCGWDPLRHHFFPYTLVLAAQTLHAVGYSLGQRLQNRADAVVVYLGDGATSEGDMSEAMNLAAVESASVLFICQNNGWAISKPTSEQMVTSIAERARGFGLTASTVNGQDADDVYRNTSSAWRHVTETRSPYLLELITTRSRGHSSSDAHTLYRDAAELVAATAADPVADYSRILEAAGVIDRLWSARVENELRAVRRCLVEEFTL